MSDQPIKGGYILLSRNILQSEIWRKPPLYLKVWNYLLLKAQHGNYKHLQKGQCRTSIPEIIEDCAWYQGYRKIYPTKDQIFQILEFLRKSSLNEKNSHVNPTYPPTRATTTTPMIATTRATQGILVTIDNYEFYQNPKNYESNDESNDEKPTRATSEQRQPDNINKNDNELKEEEREIYKEKENPTDQISNEEKSKTKQEPAKPKEQKQNFGTRISMKQSEYEELCSRFSKPSVDDKIETMDNWLIAHGKVYKDYYRALINWLKEDQRKEKSSAKEKRIVPSTFEQSDELKEVPWNV